MMQAAAKLAEEAAAPAELLAVKNGEKRKRGFADRYHLVDHSALV
jgi:hypothetical protein